MFARPEMRLFLHPLTAKDDYFRSLIGRIYTRYGAFHKAKSLKNVLEVLEISQKLLRNGILNFAFRLSQSPAVSFQS